MQTVDPDEWHRRRDCCGLKDFWSEVLTGAEGKGHNVDLLSPTDIIHPPRTHCCNILRPNMALLQQTDIFPFLFYSSGPNENQCKTFSGGCV